VVCQVNKFTYTIPLPDFRYELPWYFLHAFHTDLSI
jgi:hypothetical protein